MKKGKIVNKYIIMSSISTVLAFFIKGLLDSFNAQKILYILVVVPFAISFIFDVLYFNNINNNIDK